MDCRSGPNNEPARSPDLTPIDYCSWGCGWFKNKMYEMNVDTRVELSLRINNTADNINERHGVMQRATGVPRSRGRKRLEGNSSIFEHLL